MTDIAAYEAELRRTHSPQTVKAYLGTANRLLLYAGGAEITETVAREFLTKLSAQKGKNSSLNRHLAAMRHLFIWLQKPFKMDSYYTQETQPVWLSEDNLKLLMGACITLEEQAFVFTLAGSGIRLAEMCSLQRQKVSPAGYLTVMGKGGRERTIAVQDSVIHAISKYLMTREDKNPRVFPYSGRTYEIRLKRIGMRVGLDVHPHLLRHTYISQALAKNMPLLDVRDQAGHRKIETTNLYAHTLPQERRKRLVDVL